MKLLVTGGGGFIGRFVVGDLVKRGYEVVVIDRTPSPFIEHPRITYYTADITNVHQMNAILAKHRPEAVVHLAALLADTCEQDPVSATRVNIVATQDLIELSIVHGIRRFIFMSSASVYHPQTPEPVREEDAGKPVSYYGITKYTGELVGLWYWSKGLIDFRALRPTVVFGPGRFRGPSAEYSSILVEAAIRGERAVVKNPEDRVNYIYVRDVSRALIALVEAEKVSYRAYNAAGFVSTVMEFAELIRRYVPSFQYEIKPAEAVRYAAVIDDSRLRQELGWRPIYTYEKAIEDYIETARKGDELFRVY